MLVKLHNSGVTVPCREALIMHGGALPPPLRRRQQAPGRALGRVPHNKSYKDEVYTVAAANIVRVRMEAVGWGEDDYWHKLLKSVQHAIRQTQTGQMALQACNKCKRRPRAGYKENLLHSGIQNENTTRCRQLSLTSALNAATLQERSLLWHLGALRSRRHQDVDLCQGAPGA